MSHTAFVAAAYGISALLIAGMVAWILVDQSLRKREIADLESRGIKRRSAAGRDDT